MNINSIAPDNEAVECEADAVLESLSGAFESALRVDQMLETAHAQGRLSAAELDQWSEFLSSFQETSTRLAYNL